MLHIIILINASRLASMRTPFSQVLFLTSRDYIDYLFVAYYVIKVLMKKLTMENFEQVARSERGLFVIRLLFYFERLGMNIHQMPSISGERKFGRGNLKPLKVFVQYTVTVFKLSLKERFKRVQKGDKLSGLPKSNP